jgi:hypothetical protein
MASRVERVEAYRQQIEQVNKDITESQSGDGKYSLLRVVTFVATGLTLSYAVLDGAISAWFTLLPGAAFVAVFVIHEAKLKIVEQNKRRLIFFEQGIDRIEGNWLGTGIEGKEFKHKEHLYTGDLNLFGEASLFQKICMCTTAFGRERLSSWFTSPGDLHDIKLRQEAVREISEDDELKAAYASLDKLESEHLSIDVFKSWSTAEVILHKPALYFFSIIMGVATAASFIGWIFAGFVPYIFLLCIIIDIIMIKSYGGKVEAVTKGISTKEKNLLMLSRVLKIIESRDYKSEFLRNIKDGLKTDGVSAGDRIEQIALLINSFENARSNMAMQPLNIFMHINLRNAMRIEKWRFQAGGDIPKWVDAAADFESLFSLAVFSYENPDYIFPEFKESGPVFDVEEMGHPLLHPEKCVRNNVELGQSKSLVLISGSNMAGKSTFLRAVGVNIVLAQAGAPVCAGKFVLSPFDIGCSIQIEDNMAQGISHFKAEILRLKQLVDLAKNSKKPVMFFFDEILHGTNSSDRCNGASAVIKTLVEVGAVGFVTTHDLSLAQIVDDLDGKAVNAHFEDQFADGEMTFDYKMKDGVVARGNALELMRSEGLDV